MSEKRKKRNKNEEQQAANDNPSKSVPKKRKTTEIIDDEVQESDELQAEIQRPENVKNVVSKRQIKREKHEKLKLETKLKSEEQMQQRALNYLSSWKHNKQEWKFEKVRQKWLQTHIFDSARIPDEFWDTVVQYFGGSQGGIRKVLIDDCMKVVDQEETDENETKYKRARELLQNLIE